MMDRNESYKTAYVAAYAPLIEQYEPKKQDYLMIHLLKISLVTISVLL